MCGIVGVVGQIFKKEEDIFADLLRVDVLRGPDSTGVATMRQNKSMTWVKDIVYPDELINDKAYRSLFWGKVTAAIGHNRWATRGKVTPKNAHPFNVGKITGVHNGTLTAQYLLPDYNKFAVDSENIMHSLDKDGVDATIGKLLGAYCLVWMNNEDNTINFIRNKERPLFLTLTEDQNTLFYASEGWMLAGVLGRHGKKHGDIWQLPVDTLFTYNLDGVKIPLDKPHCRKLEGRLPPPPVKHTPPRQVHGQKGIWRGGSGTKKVEELAPYIGGVKWNKGDMTAFRVTGISKTSQASPMWKVLGVTILGGGQQVVCYINEDHYLLERLQRGVGDVFVGVLSSLWFNERSQLNIVIDPGNISVHHAGIFELGGDDIPFDKKGGKGGNKKEQVLVVDRDGNTIPEEEFKKLTKKGCAWCADSVKPEDSADLVWLDCDEFICGDCAKDTHVKEYLDGVQQYLGGN